MSPSFPRSLLGLVRCTADGELLEIGAGMSGDEAGLREGHLRCARCDARYLLSAGVLDLAGERSPAAGTGPARRRAAAEESIAIPKLAALDAGDRTVVLLLGCDDDRYATTLAVMCRGVVAVDSSFACLRSLQRSLRGATNVALVRGDVATLRLAPRAFDLLFSTPTAEAPTPSRLHAIQRLAMHALHPKGTLVHYELHRGIRERMDQCFGALRASLASAGARATRAVLDLPGVRRLVRLNRPWLALATSLGLGYCAVAEE